MRETTMRHILRRTSLLLVPLTLAALVVGTPTAAPDTDLQNVTLACSDGDSVGLTLDLAAVTTLTDVITDMTLYPTGFTCGVSTQTDPPPGGNPKSDYAVGGGDKFFTAPQLEAPCKHNFSFSMHTLHGASAPASGSYVETVPGGCAGFGDTGELRVTIDCLYVSGNDFDAHGRVTKATGEFASGSSNFTLTNMAFISGHDQGGAPADRLRVAPTSTKPTPCGGVEPQDATTHGRINVSDAG